MRNSTFTRSSWPGSRSIVPCASPTPTASCAASTAVERGLAAIAEDVRSRGFDETLGSYTRHYDAQELDGHSCVAAARIEAAESPRVSGTIDAVTRDLDAGHPLLYRYPPGRDGLPGTEGAFLPCAFWLVRALAVTGRVAEATNRFDAIIQLASPLGLYGEEMHPVTHEHLGNYPQALARRLLQAALAPSARIENRPSPSELNQMTAA